MQPTLGGRSDTARMLFRVIGRAAGSGYGRVVSHPGPWKPARQGPTPADEASAAEAPRPAASGGTGRSGRVPVPVAPATPAGLRASDADRERVAELLGASLADGRLDVTEHADRVERVYAARTLGELAGLTTDLVPRQQQPIQMHASSPQAMFGTERRGGRWVVPERLPVTVVCGTVELDLREALLQRRHVVINANVFAGTVKLTVPEGVRVEFTARSVLGSRELKIRPGDNPDVPVIEVTGTVVLGAITARTPKRRWRDRILRRA